MGEKQQPYPQTDTAERRSQDSIHEEYGLPGTDVEVVAVGEEPPAPLRPYSAFSQRTKWTVAGLGGLSALFSPISVSIARAI